MVCCFICCHYICLLFSYTQVRASLLLHFITIIVITISLYYYYAIIIYAICCLILRYCLHAMKSSAVVGSIMPPRHCHCWFSLALFSCCRSFGFIYLYYWWLRDTALRQTLTHIIIRRHIRRLCRHCRCFSDIVYYMPPPRPLLRRRYAMVISCRHLRRCHNAAQHMRYYHIITIAGII